MKHTVCLLVLLVSGCSTEWFLDPHTEDDLRAKSKHQQEYDSDQDYETVYRNLWEVLNKDEARRGSGRNVIIHEVFPQQRYATIHRQDADEGEGFITFVLDFYPKADDGSRIHLYAGSGMEFRLIEKWLRKVGCRPAI